VLNNNYMFEKIKRIPRVVKYAEGKRRSSRCDSLGEAEGGDRRGH
jgi:hypothetical protein